MTGEDGWRDLVTAALVGTGRRSVPDWPPGIAARADASPEVRLLDAAAVGGALRRAGRLPESSDVEVVGAGDDVRPTAPERARQLLDLVLAQSPVGRRLQPALLAVWCRAAEQAGVRVHHAALVPLLEVATGEGDLRDVVRPVLDERGRWLAAQRKEWAWALGAAPDERVPEVEGWALLPTAARVAMLRTVRRTDPGAGLALLGSTWSSDPATARVDLLGALRVGIGLADEPFLEAALNDRSTKVREVARAVLDHLPASRRGARMAAVLAPLVSSRWRKASVELPLSPDPAAVRDGLVSGPRGVSQRAWWLGVLTRGAPLSVWTDATGMKPERIVATLEEPAALLALRETALARGDVEWARAFVAHGWEPRLLRLLPADERAGVLTSRISATRQRVELVEVVRHLAGPWSEAVSSQVLHQLVKLPDAAVDDVLLARVLATRLHPASRPLVERYAARDTPLHDPLHRAAHYLSLVPTIEESFA